MNIFGDNFLIKILYLVDVGEALEVIKNAFSNNEQDALIDTLLHVKEIEQTRRFRYKNRPH